MRTALLTGATGLVGAHLLQLLNRSPEYDKILCLTRKPIAASATGEKVINLVIDFDKPQEHHELLAARGIHCHDAFCCLGTTIKAAGSKPAFRKVDYGYCLDFARLAQAYGAEHFLQVTAIGARKSSPVFYSRVKGELESQLKQMGFQQLSIFRPSLLVGKRNETRRGESIALALTPLLDLCLVGPLKPYRSIKAEVVAAAMLNTAIQAAKNKADKASTQILSFENMAQLA